VTVLVGLGPKTSGSVLDLATTLAVENQRIVLCGVVLDTWEGPSLATGLDPRWRQELVRRTEQLLDDARDSMPDTVNVETVVRVGPSVPSELLAEAAERKAEVLVVASSSRAAFGRVALGSISDRLAHSADLPVALTPRGYGPPGPDSVERLVLAVAPDNASFVAGDIIPLAQRLGVAVDLVTFAVSPWPETVSFDDGSWEGMFADWRRRTKEAQASVAAELSEAGVAVGEHHLVDAHRWSTALGDFRWQARDLLAVCSSRHGPVARVFLGSTAARILKHTPVPTVMLPRTR